MAFLSATELRAVWLLWSRQQLARYTFWLQLLGFDIRDVSWTSPFYLIYVLLFMAVWAFAMLALLANGTAGVLQTLAPASPDGGAMILLAIALSGWTLYELYRSSRRSPFVFTPEDALLLCQTPVSRQAVALAWFTARWLVVVLPFGLAVLVLESGVVGLQVGSKLDANDLLRYILDGLRGLALVIPWLTGTLALVWAAGAYRLQRDRDRPVWGWIAPVAGLLLVLGVVWGSHNPRVSQLGQTILWPFILPLRAAFGQAPWPTAMLVALVLAVFGLGMLFLAAGPLNLGRAAQETSRMAAQQRARLLGASGFANELARQDRLGSGRRPSRWPIGPGARAVLWKDVVQSTRDFTIGSFTPWMLMLSLGLGAAMTPEWGTKVVLAAFWILAVGQQTTVRLRSDLGRWWLWEQLPISSGRRLLAEMARTAATTILVTWLGLAAGGILGGHNVAPAMWLVPTAVSSAACAAAFAVLRRCHHDTLLAEVVPESSELGFILGLLCIAVPSGIVGGVARAHWPAWAGVSLALLIGLALVDRLWHLVVKTHARLA